MARAGSCPPCPLPSPLQRVGARGCCWQQGVWAPQSWPTGLRCFGFLVWLFVFQAGWAGNGTQRQETRAWYQRDGTASWSSCSPAPPSPLLQAAFTLIQSSFSSLTAHPLGCGADCSLVSLPMLSTCVPSPALAPSRTPELCRRLLDGCGHLYGGIKSPLSPACHARSPCSTRSAGGCGQTRGLHGLRCFPGVRVTSGGALLSVCAAREP